MTVVGHLEELRFRVLISAISFLVATIICYVFYEQVLAVVTSPLDDAKRVGGARIEDVPLYVERITGPFLMRIKVSAFGGLALSFPMLMLQLWRFITPGLHEHERKYGLVFIAASAGLFAVGAWFAFLMVPAAIKFLLGFVAPGQELLITFQDYLSFLTTMVLAFGISFEFPLLLVFLALVGIVDSRKLRSWRRYAVFLAFLVGAVATPSQDPFSQVMLSVPLYLLYEVTILVVRFPLKR